MAFTPINGHYTATFNAVDIGTSEDGIEIEETPAEEEIKTDDGGETPLDAINLGVSTTRVRLTYVEYGKVLAALYSFMAQGQPLANVGKLRSAGSKALVLTAVAGTSAAGLTGTKTYTFYLASVKESVVTKLATKCRRGPLTFDCLPDPANSNKTYVVT